MSLTITVAITVADDQAYTTREQAILTAMQAHPAGKGIATTTPADAQTENKPAEIDMTAKTKEAADARIAETQAKAAATKAAAEAKAKAAEAKAAAAAATAAAEPAADGVDFAALEAEMEADQAGATPTIDDAVTKATQYVSDGKTAQVKAALLAAGAKRVSELKGPAIATFLNALEG